MDAQTKTEAAAVLKAMGLTVARRVPPDDGEDRQGEGAAIRTSGAERGDHRGDQGRASRERITIGPPGNLLASMNTDC
ncbi:MAG: hypothetical protein ACREE9_13160 [Stellaceae bacterium]